MATQAEINEVRLYINDDTVNRDFTNDQISILIDKNNSVNYAILELFKILKARLRKELLESDTTGTEDTKVASLKSKLDLMNDLINEYQEKWDAENNNTTGAYISSTRPTISGGDV